VAQAAGIRPQNCPGHHEDKPQTFANQESAVCFLLKNDLVVGFTASAQAVGNIGPGLGEVGPMGSFAGLEPLSKIILIFQMWAGRLELIPVFLLLTPELWKKLRD
jgi:Trk-type K+ transport system membrane component